MTEYKVGDIVVNIFGELCRLTERTEASAGFYVDKFPKKQNIYPWYIMEHFARHANAEEIKKFKEMEREESMTKEQERTCVYFTQSELTALVKNLCNYSEMLHKNRWEGVAVDDIFSLGDMIKKLSNAIN